MENRANYALIGAVIIFFAAALMGVVLWMGQVQFDREYEVYDVVFDGPVNGLSEGAAVRYLGLKVGEVEELSIDSDNDARVVARIRIDSQTPVRSGSTAILDFVGLTGATFIQIQSGEGSRVKRRLGDPVPTIPTEPTQLESFVTGGQEILSEADETLARLNRILSDENIDALSSTLANVETLSNELVAEDGLVSDLRGSLTRLDEAISSLNKAAAAIESLASDSNAEVVKVSGRIDSLISTLQTSTTQLQTSLVSASERFDQVLGNLEQPAVSAFGEISIVGQELQMLIGRLDSLARELEQNPRGFVLGEPLPVRER